MIPRACVAGTCLVAAVALIQGATLRAGEASPATGSASPPLIRVTVDPRVELLSIVFHLAGNREYNQGRIPSYVKDVDEYFGPFKNHAAVVTAQRLAKERGISLASPMLMAVCLTDIASVRMRPCRDPFPLQGDSKWTPRDAARLINDLRSFVRKTNFQAFIDRHQPLYSTACERLEQALRDRRILEWLDSFFGPRPNTDFIIAIGMLNGGPCYGPSIQLADGRQEVYCVLGAWMADDAGLPKFDAGMMPTAVHEFCHSYAGPLVRRNLEVLQPAGEQILSLLRTEMRRQRYGVWNTVLEESLIRACVIRYVLATDGAAAATAETKENTDRGFLWTAELAGLLAEYETSRPTYPTLEVFTPRIVEFFNDYVAKHREDLAARLEARLPHILSVVPANGTQDVAPDLRAIIITFDRPMQEGNVALIRLETQSPLGAGASAFDETRKVLTIPVKLKPGTEYGLGLNSKTLLAMQDEKGYPLAPVTIRFKTRTAR